MVLRQQQLIIICAINILWKSWLTPGHLLSYTPLEHCLPQITYPSITIDILEAENTITKGMGRWCKWLKSSWNTGHVCLHVHTYCQRFKNNLRQDQQESPGSAADQSWALERKSHHHKLHHSLLAGALPLTPVRAFKFHTNADLIAGHETSTTASSVAWGTGCSFTTTYFTLIASPSSYSHRNLSKHKSRNIHLSNRLGAKHLIENMQFHKYATASLHRRGNILLRK